MVPMNPPENPTEAKRVRSCGGAHRAHTACILGYVAP